MTSWKPGDGPDPYGHNPGQQPPSGGQPPYGAPPQQPYGQPYPPAPYPQTPYPGPAQQGGTNGLAIASLVLAFLCSLAGLITGIIALNQIKARGQGGRGLAIAGIVISSASIVLSIVVIKSRH